MRAHCSNARITHRLGARALALLTMNFEVFILGGMVELVVVKLPG